MSSEPPPAVRISPFALPSDADLRFVLLISGVVATVLLLYHVGYSALHGQEYARIAAECRSDPSPVSCLAVEDRLTAVVMLLGLACVAVVGVLAYVWFLPGWWVRRREVKPFASTDPTAAEAITAYCTSLRIPCPPRLFMRVSRTPSALAFTYHGRAALILNLGLLLQFRLDPAAFRAVVLHELAHVRNGDVDRTFIALAAVLALVVAGGIPYLLAIGVSLFGPATADRDAAYIFGIIWRAGVLNAIVLLALAGFLRARELFADARSLAWDEPDGALRRVAASLQPTSSRWPVWFALHPTPADRQAALVEPNFLLRVVSVDAFVAGVIAATAGPELALLVGLLLAGNPVADWRDIIAGGVAGALLAGIVGLQVSRAALPYVAQQQSPRHAPRLALALGAGLIVGQTVTLTGALDVASLGFLQPAEVALAVAFGAIMLASLWAVVRWMESSVYRWVRIAASRTSARFPLRVCLATWALVFGIWYGLLLTAHDVGSTIVVAAISSSTESMQLAAWLLALGVQIGFVVLALLAALVARVWLRLAARATGDAISPGGGKWLNPNEPVLLSSSGDNSRHGV